MQINFDCRVFSLQFNVLIKRPKRYTKLVQPTQTVGICKKKKKKKIDKVSPSHSTARRMRLTVAHLHLNELHIGPYCKRARWFMATSIERDRLFESTILSHGHCTAQQSFKMYVNHGCANSIFAHSFCIHSSYTNSSYFGHIPFAIYIFVYVGLSPKIVDLPTPEMLGDPWNWAGLIVFVIASPIPSLELHNSL